MSELTLFLVRIAYLAILWIFVLSAISVIRSDMFGARLPSAAGTAPGYYVKPYVADAYYRIDPAARTAAWDGSTQFGESAPVTEGDGFRESPLSRG